MNTYAILSKKAQEVINELVATDKYQDRLAEEIVKQQLADFDANIELKSAVKAKIAEILTSDYLNIYQRIDENGEPMFESLTTEVEKEDGTIVEEPVYEIGFDGEPVVDANGNKVILQIPVINTEKLNEEINHILSDAELMNPVLCEAITLTDKEMHIINGIIYTEAVEEHYVLDLGTDEEKQAETLNKLLLAVEAVVKQHMVNQHGDNEEISSDDVEQLPEGEGEWTIIDTDNGSTEDDYSDEY